MATDASRVPIKAELDCAKIARAAIRQGSRQSGAELVYPCPNHDDKHPSLKINTRKNCWLCGPCQQSGGAWDLAAFLSGHDTSDKKAIVTWLRDHNLLSQPTSNGRRIVAQYSYTDEDGHELFQQVRYEPKDFRCRRLGASGEWIYNAEGVRQVPYNLAEAKRSDEVWIVEGEKDVNNLKRWGLVGTTNPFGAGKWRPEFNPHFSGKSVAILPDNDQPGEQHARNVARNLLAVAREVKIVRLPGLPEKGDFSDWQASGGSREQLLKLRAAELPLNEGTLGAESSQGAIVSDNATNPSPSSVPWPDPLSAEAFHGLAGQWCSIVEPHSEADTPAHLIQFLLGFGNAIGRCPFSRVAGTEHHTNLFAVLVGGTSKSRKGTSWGQDRLILRLMDSEWSDRCEVSGLSTGEGLIHFVRDPRPPRTSSPNRGKRGRSDPEDEGDPGVTDKRLLVVEPEFARVLKVSERENSTLSAVIRDAWDGRPMAVMIKRDAPRATGAHISILGHITTHELRRRLTEEAMANGFANRFLYVCTQRVRYLPEGGELHSVDLQPYLKRLKESYDFARFRYQVQRDDAAKELWHDIYRPLSEGHPGLFGQITARAEAQVLRLASIYALLDCSATVGVEHLKAALSVWHYCEQSVRFIFGTATGDPLADQILQTLRDRRDAGMTRNEIRDSFHRNRTAGQIDLALKRLAEIGVVRSTRETTDGRPAERWFAI